MCKCDLEYDWLLKLREFAISRVGEPRNFARRGDIAKYKGTLRLASNFEHHHAATP